MEKKRKEIIFPMLTGLALIFILSATLFRTPESFQKSFSYLESTFYDLLLRYSHKSIDKQDPVVVVDVDDRSLAQEGRWPWSRKKMALLCMRLQELGARVIALDFLFPETEENPVQEVIDQLQEVSKSNPRILSELEEIRGTFDYDEIFAKSLSEGEAVLGFVFQDEGVSVGQLPPPLFPMTPDMEEWLEVPNKASYLSNIALLQNAAKGGGFINSTPDPDGVIRFTPMLYRHGSEVYPSLSLAAAQLFLGIPRVQMVTAEYGKTRVLEGIQVGSILIPTDPLGKALIPFRGPPYSVPYISAADVFKGTLEKGALEGKLVFVGSSATALGDLVATAIFPTFAGVEVHAHTASGILENYLPYKPNWERGASIALILVLGGCLAVLLPFLGPVGSSILSLLLIAVLVAIELFFWKHGGISLSMVFPVFSLVAIYALNGIYGYLFEKRRRHEMKEVFSQYVPPERIDSMLKQGAGIGLEGETKDLSVLFADIRGFTALSEGMSATDLKEFLNSYLTPMTEVIFEKKGTIDKYVGDMIVAFWGAPLDDPLHPERAVAAALEMQRKLSLLNEEFTKEQLPQIRIGVGVNTGSMNVGDMGSKFRKAYTVLGDSVNLASRLEALTKEYGVKILVGEDTYQRTKALFLYRPIDRVTVRGKKQETEVYEPLSLKADASNELVAQVELHSQAFEAYKGQRWDEAKALFSQLQEKDPTEKLYQLFLAKIPS